MTSSSSHLPFPDDFDERSWTDESEHWRTSFRLGTADLEIVGRQRTSTSRLGLALELGCVRYFGAFVGDLTALPDVVLRLVSSELGIANPLEVLSALARAGRPADPVDVARLSPLVHGHIQLLGRYRFDLPTPLSEGNHRPITLPSR